MKTKGVYGIISLIGYGIIARDVLKILKNNQEKYGYELRYLIYESSNLDTVKRYADRNDIEIHIFQEKEDLTQYFLSNSTCERQLVVSANNNYIFPKTVINRDGIDIINFHNALLPEFPGRNAASWAIYENRRKTGITWHYVTDAIDGGDIIIQDTCNISENEKAFELSARLMKMATCAFEEIFDGMMSLSINSQKQYYTNERKIYRSSEVPGNGYFKLTDSGEYIYRLLRSLDYGSFEIFPKPYTFFEGKLINIVKYKIVDELEARKNVLYKKMHNGKYLKLSYSEKSERCGET